MDTTKAPGRRRKAEIDDALPNAALSRPPAIKDVARYAGVATGTVSRVLNNNSTVMPEVREKVLEAMRALKWEPSVVARSMRAGTTHAVGCIVSDVVQLTAAQMITGAEQTLRAAGYAMFVASSHNQLDDEKTILKSFRQRRIDGLILVISDDEDPAYLQELAAMNLPIVLWEREAGGLFTSVLSDHSSGTMQAVSYLAGLGHERIALVAGRPSTWVGREMVRGYRQGHASVGMPVHDDFIVRTGMFDLNECTKLLSAAHRPTAIIAPINDLALIMSVAKGMGLTTPHDLSVISVGDSNLIGMTSPSITAVRHSPTDLGRTAGDLLLEIMGGAQDQKRRVVFPAELVVRESCAAPLKTKRRR
jgi:LacI family transcriptional regulator